jgi:hypothetical protein
MMCSEMKGSTPNRSQDRVDSSDTRSQSGSYTHDTKHWVEAKFGFHLVMRSLFILNPRDCRVGYFALYGN